jgi:hypothetical protein
MTPKCERCNIGIHFNEFMGVDNQQLGEVLVR